MAYRLESLQKIIHTAVRCFQTLHTGERVYFSFRRGVVKDMRCGGMSVKPHVYITPQDKQRSADSTLSGWYPVSALCFEMPDGEIVK